MNRQEFEASFAREQPPDSLSAPLAALWWDAKGDWTHAHALVDELETADGMAVHAYVHRKGGQTSNAEYWYERAGKFRRPTLDAEWQALVESLLSASDKPK
jgi:hypothetical protein